VTGDTVTAVDDDLPGSDYAGAIYGSLLVASVVAGTSPARGAAEPWELATLLVATGVVFWLAHVYAHLVGTSNAIGWMGWENICRVARREWPIAGAVIPPAAAALVGLVVGLTDSTGAWLALGVAVAGQTGWAVAAAVTAGAGRRVVAASLAVNLALGLTIVVLKALLTH
jgi:hypothetical protein